MATDLTKCPPRSPRCKLGGYSLIPRMLDKCRGELAGKGGDYHYACPLDQRIIEFLGIDQDALKAEVATGKGDGDILTWITQNQKNKHAAAEISAWSVEQDSRGPDPESQDFFDKYLSECGPNRKDITMWADLLDLDDFVSFGGKA